MERADADAGRAGVTAVRLAGRHRRADRLERRRQALAQLLGGARVERDRGDRRGSDTGRREPRDAGNEGRRLARCPPGRCRARGPAARSRPPAGPGARRASRSATAAGSVAGATPLRVHGGESASRPSPALTRITRRRERHRFLLGHEHSGRSAVSADPGSALRSPHLRARPAERERVASRPRACPRVGGAPGETFPSPAPADRRRAPRVARRSAGPGRGGGSNRRIHDPPHERLPREPRALGEQPGRRPDGPEDRRRADGRRRRQRPRPRRGRHHAVEPALEPAEGPPDDRLLPDDRLRRRHVRQPRVRLGQVGPRRPESPRRRPPRRPTSRRWR